MFKNKTIKNIIFFDFFLQISYILFFLPFFKEVFKILLEFFTSGYFTTDIFKEILTSPIKLISFLFVLFCLSTLNLIEHISFVFVFNQIRLKNDLTILEIFNNTYKILKRRLNLRNIPILIFSIMGIPFSNFISKYLKIPEYISEYFLGKKLITLHIAIISIFAFFVIVFTIYIYHIFFLEGLNFKNSIVKSFELSKNNFKKTCKMVFQIVLKRIFLASTKLITLGIILIFFYSQSNRTLKNYEIVIYLSIAMIIKTVFNIAINYITFSEISKLYFKIEDERCISNVEFDKNNKIKLKIAVTIFTILSIATVNKYRYSIEEIQNYHNFVNLNPIISGHRGSTKQSAENTLESVKEAINLGADFTEIDVVLTKDKVVVLSHDYNLKRLCNVNKNIHSLTFEELKNYKIKNKKNSGEFSFTDLKTVIKESKGKIKLNIELKPNRNNVKELAKEVVKLIDKDYNNIVVSSLSPKILMEVKNLDSSIQCGFIVAFAYGNFYNANFADFFAIEENYVNYKMIKKIHSMNKKIFVWTTNSEEEIAMAIRKGVDGIITDEIELSKNVLKNIVDKNDFSLYKLILIKILKIIN